MKFTPEIIDEYLRRIAIGGMSARKVGKMKDMPSYEAFYQLKNRDPEVARRYLLAMESRASALDDEIDDILDAVKNGEMDYNSGRLAVDTAKWRMAKYYPRFYADNQKVDVEVEHKVSYVDELKMVAAKVAERKALQAKASEAEVIEGEVVVEGEGVKTSAPLHAHTREEQKENEGASTEG